MQNSEELSIDKNRLVGTYSLVSYVIEIDKVIHDWTPLTRGLLIYSDKGIMSAILNFDLTKVPAATTPPDRPAICYAGPYEVTASDIVHHVEVANDTSWIGRRLSRIPHWNEKGHLELRAKGSMGMGKITWRKI